MSPFIDILQDVKLGKYNFLKGDKLAVNFVGLHFNENDWKSPNEFRPERFDHENEMSLTPKGAKRNPYAWAPFNGGKRICFGKTFADINMKIFATYASQYFDWKFVSDEFSENKFPMLHIGMSKIVPIEMKITPYEEERTGCD